MGFFSDPTELERRANLKKFEDKRLTLAQKLAGQGFAPDKMLFSQSDLGGFVAVCQHGGKPWLIVSPDFGSDGEYTVEPIGDMPVRMQEVHVKSEGMGGIFGFGKKAQDGVEYHIARPDGTEVVMAFVSGRTAWAEFAGAKNPLLKTQRRKGDSNIVWDFKPVTPDKVGAIQALAKAYFGL